MRTAFASIIVVIALSVSIVVFAGAPRADEVQAVRERAQAFADAWNSHDAAAIAACWTAEGDVINPFGRVARGTAQITDLFRDEHSGPMRALRTSAKVVSTRLISPTVAVCDWEVSLSGQTQPEGEGVVPWPIRHQAVVVLQKGSDGRWLFEAVRPYQFAAAPKGLEPPSK